MTTIPTATVSELGTSLVNSYSKVVQEFRGNPGKMNEAWDDVIEQLRVFDPTNPNRVGEAHAYLSIAEQILFASAATQQ